MAGLVTALIAVLAVASNYDSTLRICGIARIEKGKALTRCDPYRLPDLLPLILVVGILLLPDIGEIELPALGSIRIRLREQEDDIARLRAAVVQLEQHTSVLTGQQQTVSIALAHAADGSVQPADGHPVPLSLHRRASVAGSQQSPTRRSAPR